MKYYESMANMGAFPAPNLAKPLNLGDATVATLLQQYQKKAISNGCGMTCMS